MKISQLCLERSLNLKFHNPIYRCEDGEEALDFLFHEADYQDPSLAHLALAIIILDLNSARN